MSDVCSSDLRRQRQPRAALVHRQPHPSRARIAHAQDLDAAAIVEGEVEAVALDSTSPGRLQAEQGSHACAVLVKRKRVRVRMRQNRFEEKKNDGPGGPSSWSSSMRCRVKIGRANV